MRGGQRGAGAGQAVGSTVGTGAAEEIKTPPALWKKQRRGGAHLALGRLDDPVLLGVLNVAAFGGGGWGVR
jgi:hypothetical protein